MRISVIGYSGSGKSTLAGKLSKALNVNCLYLDKVYFNGNWEERDKTESKEIVEQFLKTNSDWVIDGNYSKLFKKERLDQADLIVFLNFSRFKTLVRVIKRNKKHKNDTIPSIATGCIDKLDMTFIKWVLFGGRTKKKKNDYKNIIKSYKYKTIILKTQKQIDDFYTIYYADLENNCKITS